MKPEVHQEIYRVALETATAELTEISAEFDKLRVRKEQVEQLLTVLKPILDEDSTSSADSQSVAQTQPEPVTATAEPAKKEEGNGQTLGVGADPFQRRIDHVLGIGAGIRDVRQYTRQF